MDRIRTQLASKKKRRGIVACANCRSRKVRCDVECGIPCHNCKTDQKTCFVVRRKRRGDRPETSMRTHDVEWKKLCVATPSSSSTGTSPFQPEWSPPPTAPPSVSGSPAAVSDEAIATWIRSCPIPPTAEIRSRLQSIVTRGKSDEPDQRPRELSQMWNLQDDPKQFANVMDDDSKDVFTPSPSAIDSDFNQSIGDDAFHQCSADYWRRETHDLLRMCKDLVAISCRLSETVLNSLPTNAMQTHRSSVGTREALICRDTLPSRKEPDLPAGPIPAPWDVVEESALPDEIGTNSFDCLLQMWDPDISSEETLKKCELS